MKYFLILIAVGCCLGGCNKKPDEAETPSGVSANQRPPGAGGGSGNTIAPMSSVPIGSAPVANSDSVLGAGGGGAGVGTAMKAKAKDIAAGDNSSMDQGGGEEDPGGQ
jgi:hypothetical protein